MQAAHVDTVVMKLVHVMGMVVMGSLDVALQII